MNSVPRAENQENWLERFGLRRRPFVAVPSPEHYYPVEPIESARQNLARMVRRGEGAGLVAGPPGTGKSLLCHLVAQDLEPEFAVVLLGGGRIDSPRALWQATLFRLGFSFQGLDEGELRIALEAYLRAEELPEFLRRSPRAILPPRPMVLLIDEAHGLPLRILEDIRSLTNIVINAAPRAHVILAGGMLLEDRLNSPRLEAFCQRIVVRAYLQPFTRPQTEGFIRHQIALAGGNPERLFSPDALEAVHRASGGIPRFINQICDHALLLAHSRGRERVDWQLVEEAWADLQQLPAPWNDSFGRAGRGNIIEFGNLSDADRSESPEPHAKSITVPFLRIAPTEASHEDTTLATLNQLQEAVEALVHADLSPNGSATTPLFGEGNSPAAEPPTTAAADSPYSSSQLQAAAASDAGSPSVLQANPLAEAFDSEIVVELSHVEYICRQSRPRETDRPRHGRRAFWAVPELVSAQEEAFVFPPSFGDAFPAGQVPGACPLPGAGFGQRGQLLPGLSLAHVGAEHGKRTPTASDLNPKSFLHSVLTISSFDNFSGLAGTAGPPQPGSERQPDKAETAWCLSVIVPASETWTSQVDTLTPLRANCEEKAFSSAGSPAVRGYLQIRLPWCPEEQSAHLSRGNDTGRPLPRRPVRRHLPVA
jgi:type II secretory pathway predicted ATPase ExeA